MPSGSTSPLTILVSCLQDSDALNTEDAIVMFFLSLGGAISISIAQNIFTNTLVKQIPNYTTGIDGATILAIGATHLRDVVPPSQLAGVLEAYTVAIDTSFILPIAAGALCVVAASFVSVQLLLSLLSRLIMS